MGNSFNIRKSLARLLYYIEQLENGKDKSAILKDLDFSNDEWQTLTKELLLFSNSKNNDWHISSLIEMKLINHLHYVRCLKPCQKKPHL